MRVAIALFLTLAPVAPPEADVQGLYEGVTALSNLVLTRTPHP